MSPISALLEALTLGQSQLVSLANTLNGDAYVFGGQLISALSNGGSLVIASLGQAFNQIPSLGGL
jgi:hypothetical protein